MTDERLDRLGADGFVAERMTWYAALYPRLREIARQHGYALALHGTLAKDLDVVAVPWVEEASRPEALVVALVEACGGFLTGSRAGHATTRPHGRTAWTIHLGRDGGYVDLSVLSPR